MSESGGQGNTPMASLMVAPDQVSTALDIQIAKGEQLQTRSITSVADLSVLRDDFYSWDEYNQTLLKRSFSTSEVATTYSDWHTMLVSTPATFDEQRQQLLADIGRCLRKLRSVSEQLPLYSLVESNLPTKPRPDAQNVFIVHGHDDATKQEVARFVQQVTRRNPIILHEQPNSGRTAIEKFEEQVPAAGFAIVLLTGDDEGRKRGTEEHQPRARQNVILELGFFMGALGRDRVAALYKDDVELPSDISGMLYTSLDRDWKIELGREMRSAGIVVDMNEAL